MPIITSNGLVTLSPITRRIGFWPTLSTTNPGKLFTDAYHDHYLLKPGP